MYTHYCYEINNMLSACLCYLEIRTMFINIEKSTKILRLNPLPHMLILGHSNSEANKYIMSKNMDKLATII